MAGGIALEMTFPIIVLLVLGLWGAYLLIFAKQFCEYMIRHLQLPSTVLIYRLVGGVLMSGCLFMVAKFALHDY